MRSGYSDSCDGWDLIRWRGAVASAIRGKRGQAFLREMLASLDALPDKRLIAEELEQNGEVCAIGSVGKARGVDMSKLDVFDPDTIANAFGIATALVQEIEYINDEDYRASTPEKRFEVVRKWVVENIKPAIAAAEN
jgi:hypothetical protein